MKYYLHDSNSFNDEKVTELYMKFGYEGLGLFYTTLEKLAQQEKPMKTTVLKSQLNVGKRLVKCWNFMESIELIHSNNGDTFNKQLMNYCGKYKIKKEKNAIHIAEWRSKQELTKNVISYESVCNNSKLKENKINENNTIRDKSDIPIMCQNDEFLLTISEKWKPIILRWMNYKKEKGQQYKGSTSLNTMYEKLKKISSDNPVTGAEIINNSISNNYSGFFELNHKSIEKMQTGKILQPKTIIEEQILLNRLK